MTSPPTSEKTLPILTTINVRILLFSAAIMAIAAFGAYRYFAFDADWAFYVAVGAGICLLGAFCLHLKNFNQIASLLIITVIVISVTGVGTYLRQQSRLDAKTETKINQEVICTLDSPLTEFYEYKRATVVVSKNQPIASGEWTVYFSNAVMLPIEADLGIVMRFSRFDAESDGCYGSDFGKDDKSVRRIDVDYEAVRIDESRGGDIFAAVRYACINAIRDGMTGYNAAIASALLFGEKGMLASDENDVFRVAGLAHAMAVSGLHVGFLLSILDFFLRKLRKHKIFGFSFILTMTLFYALVCGGAVSVVRATIMGLLTFLSTVLGRRSDPFNNIAIALMIILTYQPTAIVSISMLLSFLSVCAIFVLSPMIKRCLTSCKIPNKIASALSLTISTTVGLLPITATYFNTLNPWSLFANLIGIPIIEICFITTLIFLPIALLFPPILVVAEELFVVFYAVAHFFFSLPAAETVLFSFGGFGILTFYLSFFLLGGLIMYGRKKLAVILRCVAFAVMISVIAVNFVPKRYTGCNVCAVGSYSPAMILNANNTTVIASQTKNLNAVNRFLCDSRLSKVDVMIVTEFEEQYSERLRRFCKRFYVDNLVFDFDEKTTPMATSYFPSATILLDAPMEYSNVLLSSEKGEHSVDVRIDFEWRAVLLLSTKKSIRGYADCVVTRKWLDDGDNIGFQICTVSQNKKVQTTEFTHIG